MAVNNGFSIFSSSMKIIPKFASSSAEDMEKSRKKVRNLKEKHLIAFLTS